MNEASKPRSIGQLGFCFIGPALWAAHLIVLYGGHTLICTRMTAGTGNVIWPFLASITTAITLFGIGGFVALQSVHASRYGREDRSSRPMLLRDIALALSGFSALGIIWGTLPVALVHVCN